MVTVPEQRYVVAAQATGEPAIIMAVQEYVDERIGTAQSVSTLEQQRTASSSRASPPVRAV